MSPDPNDHDGDKPNSAKGDARGPAKDTGASEDAILAGWYRMAGVGIEFVVAIGLFSGIGYLIDRWLNSSPWGLLIGAGLGFAIGLRAMVRVARKSFKE
ncbi:MAG: AtpZ/AtpI family protein [Tepidisphaeraceae bacterium]